MLLIVTPNYKGEVPILSKTAAILGWDVYNQGWRVPEHLLKERGAVYGEQFFCEVIAEQMGWKLLNNRLDWLTTLPEEYVSRKIEFMTMSEARKIRTEKFIKPADDKCFESRIYANGDLLPKTDVLDDAPTIVSDVMKFTSEYRCFIKDRSVISMCCYLYKDYTASEPDINKPERYSANSEAVIEFVTRMLLDERVDCVPGSVIDIGRFKKDTYAVIESNPVYASGLYGCDTVASLAAIKAGCISE